GWAPRIGDRFGLVIVDEAHHVGAWCPGEVLEMLVAPARLGLTATPPAPGGELGYRVGPVVYSLAVDALAGEALADYEAISVALRDILRRHPGERALVFTADNATAYRIARELLVMPITHEIGRAERAEVLAKFRAGEISVLVSSQVLDEGVDVPDADIAIIVG